MKIKSVEQTSYEGMYKLTPEQGVVFYARQEYLSGIELDNVQCGSEFVDDDEEALLDAGLICAVELKAVSYLARSEQCRFGLKRKLLAKQYKSEYIDKALSFLESRNYLSDERYAAAWLNDRRINHYEGQTKLLLELQSRGIDKTVATDAVKEFFTDNDEEEICRKACERFVKKGKSEDKLIEALLKAGFAYKMIKNVMDSETD